MPKQILALFGLLAAATFSVATPLIDEPIAELHLADGEVLQDAQAKGFNHTSVLVKYRDGAKTVPYAQFPENLQAALLAKKPKEVAVSRQPTQAKVHIPVAGPPAKTVPKSRIPEERYHGLALVSTEPGTIFSTVEIYNDSVEDVKLDPASLLAETESGKVLVGRRWVQVTDGQITGTMKDAQEIGPKSSATLQISFPGLPPGVAIRQIVWSQK